jgi:26S proteasome regulatory subunit N1
MKRQLAFLLARAQIPIEWLQSSDADGSKELPTDLMECLSNAQLSTRFKEFGKELGVVEAKSLEDVYKTHLENTSTCFISAGTHSLMINSLLRTGSHGER